MIDHPSGEMLLEYACDELAPDAAENIEAHLSACVVCRCDVEETRRLFAEVGSLPKELYPSVGLSVSSLPSLPDLPTRNPLRSSARSHPVWKAAAAVILLGLGVWTVASVTSGVRPELADADLPADNVSGGIAPGDEGGDTSFTRALAEYRSITDELMAEVVERGDADAAASPGSSVAVVLASLDQAVADTEQAIDELGSDPVLEEMLVKRYQQRIDLLRQSLDSEAAW